MLLSLRLNTSLFFVSQIHDPEAFSKCIHSALAKHCAESPVISPGSVREFVDSYCRENCSAPAECEAYWATTEPSTLIVNISLKGENTQVAH